MSGCTTSTTSPRTRPWIWWRRFPWRPCATCRWSCSMTSSRCSAPGVPPRAHARRARPCPVGALPRANPRRVRRRRVPPPIDGRRAGCAAGRTWSTLTSSCARLLCQHSRDTRLVEIAVAGARRFRRMDSHECTPRRSPARHPAPCPRGRGECDAAPVLAAVTSFGSCVRATQWRSCAVRDPVPVQGAILPSYW